MPSVDDALREVEDRRTVTPAHPEHNAGAHYLLRLDALVAVELCQGSAAGKASPGNLRIFISIDMLRNLEHSHDASQTFGRTKSLTLG